MYNSSNDNNNNNNNNNNIAIQDKFTLTKFSLRIEFHKELSILLL